MDVLQGNLCYCITIFNFATNDQIKKFNELIRLFRGKAFDLHDSLLHNQYYRKNLHPHLHPHIARRRVSSTPKISFVPSVASAAVEAKAVGIIPAANAKGLRVASNAVLVTTYVVLLGVENPHTVTKIN